MSDKLIPATEAEIAALAHTYWEAEGRPDGRHDIHWQRAYLALTKHEAVKPVAKAAKPRAKAETVKPTKSR